MSTLQNLENTLIEWYKKSPVHLPESARKWIGDNAWWIVVIGVILSVVAIVSSLRALFWTDQLLRQAEEWAAYVGVSIPSHSLAADIGLWVSVATFAAVTIIELRAIQPLRAKEKSGWDLIFIATIISLVGSLASGIISGSIIGPIVGAAIGAVIGGFFLFETRSQFIPAKRPTHSTAAEPKDDTSTSVD